MLCSKKIDDDLTNKDQQQVEELDNGLNDVVPYTYRYHEMHAPRADSNGRTGNQNKSLCAFEGLMEQMKSRDHYTIKILRHNIEHYSIINLLKILEDSQCPDYMLQSIFEWANCRFGRISPTDQDYQIVDSLHLLGLKLEGK